MARGLSARIQEYVQMRPGQTVYLTEIQDAVPDATEIQIRQAMSNLVRLTNEYSVEIKARAWMYRPPTRAGAKLYEELAVTRGGEVLIQDTDGVVYRATEI